MKKIIPLLSLLFGCHLMGHAQCDKKVTFSASKAVFMDGNGNVRDSIQEQIVVQISKTAVKLTHGGREDDALTGPVKDYSCQWMEAYKNGVSVIKSELTENNGNVNKGTITIEGKKGKIMITLDLEDTGGEPKKIKIFVDKYEEQE